MFNQQFLKQSYYANLTRGQSRVRALGVLSTQWAPLPPPTFFSTQKQKIYLLKNNLIILTLVQLTPKSRVFFSAIWNFWTTVLEKLFFVCQTEYEGTETTLTV